MSSWAMIQKPDGTAEFRPCTPETAQRSWEQNVNDWITSLIVNKLKEPRPGEQSTDSNEDSDDQSDDETEQGGRQQQPDSKAGGPAVGLTTEVFEATLRSRGLKLERIRTAASIEREKEREEARDEEENFRKGVMSKKFLDYIIPILRFEQDDINSLEVHVPPVDQPIRKKRFGAGRVLQYRQPPKGGKIMSCDTSSDGYITRALASSYRGAYTFLPGIDERAHYQAGLVQARGPFLNAGKKSVPYHVSHVDVKKMSAWGWHRTYQVYERAAMRLALGGTQQTDLGLISIGHGAARELVSAVFRMRMRARGARQHAFTLYPRLLDAPVFPPLTTKPFRDNDRNYYMELYRNQENVKRAELHRQFKEFAFTCLCEAISVFLNWEEENGKGTTKEAKLTDPDAGLYGDYSSLTKLWESATKWNASAQRGGIQYDEFRAEEFRSWWIRAAMARGHAEWLLEERWDKGHISIDQWKPMEAWRRLPPPPLGCYDNDCGVFAVYSFSVGHSLEGRSGMRTTADDLYFSEYNGVQVQMRELDAMLNHVPNYCFAPGAPDFVYSRRAAQGWAGNHIGLSPLDRSAVRRETGHYDRYIRQGLVDTLATPVSEYERDLALCADHIVLEWQKEFQVKSFELVGQQGNLMTQLGQLEADIGQLCQEREGLTRAEAEDAGFEATVCRLIGEFLSGLPIPPAESLFKERGRHKHISFMEKVQFTLRQQLDPWLRLVILQGIAGSPAAVLLDQDTRDIIAPNKRAAIAASDSMITVEIWLAWQHTRDVFNKLYEVAESIIDNRLLLPDERELAFCFRDYLTTGDNNKLPMVHYGVKSYRQMSPTDFYQTYMAELAIPPSWLRNSPFGHPPHPTATRKAALSEYFCRGDPPISLPNTPRPWQCITGNPPQARPSPGEIARLLRERDQKQSARVTHAILATPAPVVAPNPRPRSAGAVNPLSGDERVPSTPNSGEVQLYPSAQPPKKDQHSRLRGRAGSISDAPPPTQGTRRGRSPPARFAQDMANQEDLLQQSRATTRPRWKGLFRFRSTGNLRSDGEPLGKQPGHVRKARWRGVFGF